MFLMIFGSNQRPEKCWKIRYIFFPEHVGKCGKIFENVGKESNLKPPQTSAAWQSSCTTFSQPAEAAACSGVKWFEAVSGRLAEARASSKSWTTPRGEVRGEE